MKWAIHFSSLYIWMSNLKTRIHQRYTLRRISLFQALGQWESKKRVGDERGLEEKRGGVWAPGETGPQLRH